MTRASEKEQVGKRKRSSREESGTEALKKYTCLAASLLARVLSRYELVGRVKLTKREALQELIIRAH